MDNDDKQDVVPGALAQRFKDERNIVITELETVIKTALATGIPRVVDGWERGANDLVAALVDQNEQLHKQLLRAEEALHHTTQLVREEVNAAKNLGDTQGDWWDRATSALTASDAVLKEQ